MKTRTLCLRAVGDVVHCRVPGPYEVLREYLLNQIRDAGSTHRPDTSSLTLDRPHSLLYLNTQACYGSSGGNDSPAVFSDFFLGTRLKH